MMYMHVEWLLVDLQILDALLVVDFEQVMLLPDFRSLQMYETCLRQSHSTAECSHIIWMAKI